jgi:hemerythrin superfamily protein
MTLQTFEEQEILRRVRAVEHKLDRLFLLCEKILQIEQPHYRPTTAIVVIPKSEFG